jgi:hypothetical protein
MRHGRVSVTMPHEQVIILNEVPLGSVLAEFVRYYNPERPRRTLRLEPPLPVTRPTTGAVCARPVLGGSHHTDARACAGRMVDGPVFSPHRHGVH